uniref:Activator of basal transcription 1 n=1 Tax=Lepeophtheirus salmonis TaxID=72036 RepID=A0A0K2UH24_LEPSM
MLRKKMSSSSSNDFYLSDEEMDEDINSLQYTSEDEDDEADDKEEVGGKAKGSCFVDHEEGENGKGRNGKKKKKPGIIYLSSIPHGFNVSRTTAYFSKFGQVGRVFLQPNSRDKNKLKSFIEGWIEYMSKSVAREVAESINCTHVGGKKRSKSHDVLWNVKYLPRFKWSHLTERMNYEKVVHNQKMRNEVSQAKKEVDYFRTNIDKCKNIKTDEIQSPRPYDFFLKDTESAIFAKRKRQSTTQSPSPYKKSKREATIIPSKKARKNKGKGKSSTQKRSEFLKNVFGGSAD